MKKKGFLIGAAIVCLILSAIGIYLYGQLWSPNTAFSENNKIMLVRTGTDFDQLCNQLEQENLVKNITGFQFAAKLKKFTKVKPGRYKLKSGMSNVQLVNMLRAGDQEALLIRLDGMMDLHDVAGALGKKLEHDSLYFESYFSPDTAMQRGFTPEAFSSFFIADTYDFFWNMTGEEFLQRMKTIYDAYWTKNNLNKAQALQLSPAQVATLASIVKGETAIKEEAPKIAGLYLNRLHQGIRLQADPTVLFAIHDASRQRVLPEDLQVVSAYNTYQIDGLPPGPISLPEKTYLDAVLNAESHAYIYMCAQPENTGFHNFTSSYDQHLQNAKAYHDWLNRSNIRR